MSTRINEWLQTALALLGQSIQEREIYNYKR